LSQSQDAFFYFAVSDSAIQFNFAAAGSNFCCVGGRKSLFAFTFGSPCSISADWFLFAAVVSARHKLFAACDTRTVLREQSRRNDEKSLQLGCLRSCHYMLL
jgi:hypothetical protein